DRCRLRATARTQADGRREQGQARADPALRPRHRAVPRPRRRCRRRVGLGHQLARRRPRPRVLRAVRARRDRRFPPLLHPRRLQGRAVAALHPGRRRLAVRPGRRDPLGRRPPPAPRLQRQGGRPAQPLAVRRDRDRAAQGPVVRAHRLAVRPGPHQPEAVHPGPARRQGHRPHRAGLPGPGAGQPRPPGAARRTDHDVLGRRAERVLLGQPGPHRPAAPRHLVDQLDLPRDRRAPVRRPGQVGQLLAAGDHQLRRVLAQLPPRRPVDGPARRAARPARHLRPGHLGLREARLGPGRPVAHPGAHRVPPGELRPADAGARRRL
ncbi:MAG: Fatty acid desaturase; Delta-9 fatty acid desaturase, partial [uncultured Corynebacteriales bacterium]